MGVILNMNHIHSSYGNHKFMIYKFNLNDIPLIAFLFLLNMSLIRRTINEI